MLNKVMLIGRLGKDPEIRYSSAGNPIVNMSLATDESYVDRDGNKVERTEWHTIVAYQKQAENCKAHLAKGSLIYVEGSLQTRKWQDQQGQDRYSTEIKAVRVQFLDRKGKSQGDNQERPSQQNQKSRQGNPQQSQSAPQNQQQQQSYGGYDNSYYGDDVPF